MRILHLCNKEWFDKRMDRNRDHSINAIGKLCELKKSGPGWKGFTSAEIEVEKHKADLVIWYKPLTILGYQKVKVPKCIRYNEMYAIDATKKEIIKSKSNLIICHHENDIKNYKTIQAQFFHIPHCAEKSIFKDYKLNKKYDITIVGMISWAYPLREKLYNLMQTKLSKEWNCDRKKHPGYKITNAVNENEAVTFANYVNESKITMTCSSKFKYALSKYAEIPMCNSILAGDLPDERQDFFRQFMIILDLKDSDEIIINKLRPFLTDDKKRKELSEKGMRLALENMTQEHYAKQFMKIAEKII